MGIFPAFAQPAFKNSKAQMKNLLEWERLHIHFPPSGMRTICFNAQPIQKENGEHWILLALDDMTLRKEVEKIEKIFENLKMILETIPQITSTASADGAVTYFNQFFLDYSGFSLCTGN